MKNKIKSILKEDSVREVLLTESKIKPIRKVKPGDIAIDYNDNTYEVIAVGVGRDGWKKLKKYDDTGAMSDVMKSPDEYDVIDINSLAMIAVKDPSGGNVVFTYDYGGAYVKA